MAKTLSRAPSGQKAWYQQVVDQTVGSSFMKRYSTIEEQAAAILFLASDEASYITGTVLPMAGGNLGQRGRGKAVRERQPGRSRHTAKAP